MTQMDDAKAKLTAALERLETALMPLGEARRRHARDGAEIASLVQEREELLARIATLEEENRALASLTEEVEVRVDRAIADIHAALGRAGAA